MYTNHGSSVQVSTTVEAMGETGRNDFTVEGTAGTAAAVMSKHPV